MTDTGSDRPSNKKHLRLPTRIQQKSAAQELEVLESHWLLDLLEEPNPIQNKWDFVYTFLCNLVMTGWSYVIGGKVGRERYEIYTLPTTWITADHKKGPFSAIEVKNPNRPGKTEKLKKGEFAFARLPNPRDPLAALAPASTQITALRIDDYIQSSRERFFRNGIFPGALVTVGKNPHPNVPSGVAPRLTNAQRRQVYGVIRKLMGGVANYGNPAILDGYIEKIERLTMKHNEMGWEKSEEVNRKRILAAFGVHPFILGEAISVGGYAQAAIIKQQFCDKVNTYLDLFSGVMTQFVAPLVEEEDLVVWLEDCEAKDPQLEASNMHKTRERKDMTQNEFRAFLGLPPDEDNNEQFLDKGMLQPLAPYFQLKQKGELEVDQLVAILEALGLPNKIAKAMAGPKVEKPEPPPQLQGPGTPPPPGQPPQNEEEQVAAGLQEAAKLLRSPWAVDAEVDAKKILEAI